MTSANWLFLTGMMGAGKTTVGQRAAQALGWRFVDLDQRIEQEAGSSIASIFASEGEAAFRARERAALERLLTATPPSPPSPGDSPGTVLALGGGTFVQDGAADLLRSHGPTVYLNVPPHELVERLSSPEAASRPLWGDAEALEALLARRHDRYLTADLTIDAAGLEPGAVCAAVLQELGQISALRGFDALKVELGSRSYPIWIGDGGVEEAAEMVGLQLGALDDRPSQLFVVTDDRVAPLYLQAFEERLRRGPWRVSSVVVPEGESSKSLDRLGQVLTALLERQPGRRDVVVALGGGVVGDLAGFAAAVMLRGVRLVQVPTTVLAQVDSSVGGKTGVNHARGKNLVGAFHQPTAVVMALGMLQTLERRQVSSGLAEVVKYAVLDGEPLLEELEGRAERLVAEPQQHGDLVARCCAIKARVVADDERERSGSRVTLNLGHTFGHAIEAMGGYGEVTHGEAVALGTLLAARASRVLGLARSPSEGQLELEGRLEALFKRLELPTEPAGYLRQGRQMAGWMKQDKKAQGDQVTLILPVAAGDVRLHPVRTEALPTLLEQLARGSQGG
ncbi:MAG: 3-dehydroquinate synthase [Myxococcales bacterium]|nr:3-dehydroquinate synthase [Myxococcales bacterium]